VFGYFLIELFFNEENQLDPEDFESLHPKQESTLMVDLE